MGKLGVGLDFGTSNTSVAIYDGNKVNLLPIDPTNQVDYILPTAIYFDRNYRCKFGQEAIQTYIEENMGRQIHLTPYELGYIEMTFGESDTFRGNREAGFDTTVQVEVHALVDQEMNGQLFRYIKKALSARNMDRINVFEKKFTVVAMLTIILTEIRKRIEKIINMPIDTIHIGMPVKYSEDNELNQKAIEQMKNACKNAGYRNFEFCFEPLGAINSYSKDTKVFGNALVFDFGGGTLDISITSQDGKVIAVNGVPIGGSHFDKMIYQKKLFKALGKDVICMNILGGKSKFQFDKFEDYLLNWTHTYLLNTQKNLELIRIASRSILEGDPNALKSLYLLITGNYSYLAYKGIEEAKCHLSEMEGTVILVPPVGIEAPLTRLEFNSFIDDSIQEIEKCIKRTLDEAGMREEDIDVVIRTGGSSLIPLVKDMLDRLFPGKVLEYDIFTSVAAGLAIADYHRKEGL